MATSSNPDGLTIRQRRAIAALLTGRNIKAAAAEAKVGERTLHAWLVNNAAFRAALAQAEGERMGEAGRALLAGQAQALYELKKLVKHAQSESVKRAAIRDWLEFMFRYRDGVELERRLTELEKAVYHDNPEKHTTAN